MFHEIRLDERPTGTDQEVLDSVTCPGCDKKRTLKWKNTGGQVDREVIRSECSACGDDVHVIVPGGLMGGGLAALFGR